MIGRTQQIRRLFVVLAVSLGTLSMPLTAWDCPPGENIADTDGDGEFDYACVGDWNDNGICEMQEDIEAALLALEDTGPKLVHVAECNYLPPAEADGQHGIITLASNTTFIGSGPGTVLNGFVAADVTSEEAVVTNRDHTLTNENIVISDVKIDGGWRAGDESGLEHARMGIRFTGCTNCRAERVEVTDTLHACLYSSNSTNIEFLDSTLKRCGNLGGIGSKFPCVYLYAFNGRHTRNVTVRNIECDGSGLSALATRRNTTDSTLTDLLFENNTLRNTEEMPTGGLRPCITISGVGSGQYLNNSCTNTGGVTNQQTESWYTDELEVNASANVLIDGLQIHGSNTRAPVFVRKHAENFTLRNITVHDVTDASCMAFNLPLRNFSLDGATLSNCGEWGIQHIDTEPSGDAADQALTFRNIDISNVGTTIEAEGLRIRGAVKDLLLDNVTVNGASSHGVRLDGLVENSTLSNLTVSNVPKNGIYLAGDTRNTTLTSNEVDGAGWDCVLLEGTPSPAIAHQHTVISETMVTNCAGRGIALGAGELSVQDLRVDDNTVDGVGGDGIEIVLAGTENDSVKVESNLLRDVGRSAGGGPFYGIELAGTMTGTTVSENGIDDLNDQATYGIFHDVPESLPGYLCSNSCSGTLLPTECLHDAADLNYEVDSDLDGTVDACEDTDRDGVLDTHDNCLEVYNPSQSDFDSDAEGDHCDLDDGLIYVRFQQKTAVSWQLEGRFDGWNVYVGELATLRAGGDYTQEPGSNPLARRECGIVSPPLTCENDPDAGQIAFYLVTGFQAGSESSLGSNSNGMLRPNTFPCPGQVPPGTLTVPGSAPGFAWRRSR